MCKTGKRDTKAALINVLVESYICRSTAEANLGGHGHMDS